MITSKFSFITTKKWNRSSRDGADGADGADGPDAPDTPGIGGSPLILLLRSIINILEPIFTHALFKKDHTGGAGLRSEKNTLPVFRKITCETHDIHIGITQLGDIPKLLDNVAFGVDAALGVAGTTAPGTIVIRCLGQDLAALHDHGHVEMGVVAITEPLCPRIIEKLLQDSGLRKMCHTG
jgi:hypothetical protein